MIKYSIVIPTYLSSKVLFRTLGALLDQKGINGENYEILLVDDRCNENMKNHIESLDTKYSLRYLYLDEGPGLSRDRARNFGWKAALGEIVVFLDSDILVQPDYFSELERCYRLNSDIIVVGVNLYQTEDYDFDGEEYRKQIYSKVSAKRNRCMEERHIAFQILSYNISAHRFPWLMVFGCNLAVPKKLLKSFGGFDEGDAGAAGMELGYRMHRDGIRIIVNHKLEAVHQYYEFAEEDLKIGKDCVEGFISKYPGAFENIPQGEELEIFYPRLLLQDRMMRGGSNNKAGCYKRKHKANAGKEVINFKNKAELERLKEYIIKNSSKENLEIVIMDYVEDTDLDLWIQLTDFEGIMPQYHPVSKKITVDVSVHDMIDKLMSADGKNEIIPPKPPGDERNLPDFSRMSTTTWRVFKRIVEVKLKRLNLLLTKHCNLHCKMCDYTALTAGSKEFTSEEIKKLLADVRELGLEQLELSGGEPMVRPDIYDIISFARSLGVNVIIMMTNGVLIGEEEAKRLVSSGLTDAVISLEGTEELNDSIRGKGNFKKALHGVRCLQAAGIRHIRIGITITKSNYKHMLSLTRYLFEEVGIGSISYNPFTSGMMAAENFEERKDDFLITKELLEDLKQELEQVIEEAACKGWNIPLENYLRKIPDYFACKAMIPINGCIQPQTGCCIDSNGGVYGCWGEPTYSGSIRSHPIKEIIASQIYQNFCKIAKNGKCKGCLMACYENIHRNL